MEDKKIAHRFTIHYPGSILDNVSFDKHLHPNLFNVGDSIGLDIDSTFKSSLNIQHRYSENWCDEIHKTLRGLVIWQGLALFKVVKRILVVDPDQHDERYRPVETDTPLQYINIVEPDIELEKRFETLERFEHNSFYDE